MSKKRQTLDTLTIAKSRAGLAMVNRNRLFQPPVKKGARSGCSPANELRGLSSAARPPPLVLSCLSKRRARQGSIPAIVGFMGLRLFPPRAQRYHTAILSRLKVILRPKRLPALVEKRKMPQRRIRSLAQFLHRLRPLLRVKAITQKIARL